MTESTRALPRVAGFAGTTRLAESGVLDGTHVELINGKLLDGSDALAPARFQHSLRDGSAQRPSPHDLVLTQLPLALTDQDEREPDVAVVAGTINDHAVQHPTSAVPLVGAESAASENGVRTVDYLSEGTWRFVCEHELPMGCAAWRQPNCCLHAMNCGDPHEEAIHEARKGIKEVALTRVDAAFAGSAYAAYGGIYIAASLVWLWLIERQQPTASDMIGATIGIVGALVVVGFAAGT